jgi:hypothetical protein
VRPLTAADAREARRLLVAQQLAELHPLDRDDLDVRRATHRLNARYNARVVGATPSLAVASGSRIEALALYGDADNPITGRRERHLLDVAHDDTAATAPARLLAAVIARAERDGVDVVRAEASAHGAPACRLRDAFATLGFREQHVVLRRRLEPAARIEGRFALTSPEHAEFAYACMADGAENTYRGWGAAVDRTLVRRVVRRRYRRLQTPRRISLLAFDDAGRPRAHALAELVPGRVRPRREALLYDIFVPERSKGQGWAQQTWRKLEALLAERGADRCTGTVVHAGSGDGVAAALRAAGWWLDRNAYVLTLRGERDAVR